MLTDNGALELMYNSFQNWICTLKALDTNKIQMRFAATVKHTIEIYNMKHV